jgi:hypothetical protein
VPASESLTRTYGADRSISETVPVSESVETNKGLVRTIMETVGISETVDRIVALVRSIAETVGISELLETTYTPVGGSPPPAETKQFGGAGGRRLKRTNFKLKRWFK